MKCTESVQNFVNPRFGDVSPPLKNNYTQPLVQTSGVTYLHLKQYITHLNITRMIQINDCIQNTTVICSPRQNSVQEKI